MGNPLPHASRQLTLNLEQGLSSRHLSLRSCMAAGVYSRGLDRVAVKVDMSPSKLCEKLAGGGGDRKRDVGLEEFERYLDKTGDKEPIYYLVDKYLSDPSANQANAMATLAALAEHIPALLAAAGLNKTGGK